MSEMTTDMFHQNRISVTNDHGYFPSEQNIYVTNDHGYVSPEQNIYVTNDHGYAPSEHNIYVTNDHGYVPPEQNICVTNDHRYVPFVVITIIYAPCYMSNMTGDTCEQTTAFSSGVHEFNLRF